MIPIAKPFLGEEEAALAREAILSGWVTQGPKVKQFEQDFCAFTGAKHAVAVSNCTTALHLAMVVSEIGIGDEVICPSMSYVATANSVRYVGATPVFAEVNQEYNLDIEDVKRKITRKTKAILLVHQIGMPADIDAYSDLCAERNLTLIEDAACAIGSAYKGNKIGSHSNLVCFSFHPRKVITTGDGGMIATQSEEIADKLRLLRQHGMSVNDRVRHESKKVIEEDHVVLGYNYRLTDIQAAVGIEQLKRLPGIIEERRKIAQVYHDAFKDLPGIVLPLENPGYFSNYQSYSVWLKDYDKAFRDQVMQNLLDQGIATRRGIMTAHRETAYQGFTADLPLSEHFADTSICLPLFVPMSQADIQAVIVNFKAQFK
ncbi:MAG: DegT/DnrJ/EryC1/StrS family aminotransferase [Luteibaculum sp.]